MKDSVHTARYWGGLRVEQNAMKANGISLLTSHIEGLDPRMHGTLPPVLKNGHTCEYSEGKSATEISGQVQ